jgi:hypothetical protein
MAVSKDLDQLQREIDAAAAVNAAAAPLVATFSTLVASTTYANDAAAAAGGVPVGQVYRNGNIVQMRIV